MAEVDFRAIVETVNDGVAVCDREGRVLYANAAARRATGATLDRLIGRHYLEIFPSLERGAFDLAFRRVVESGRPELVEAPSAIRDAWIVHEISPLPSAVRVSWHDLEDPRGAGGQAQHLALALEVARAWTWEYDPASREITGGRPLRALCGVGAGEVFTLDALLARVLPEDRGQLLESLAAAVKDDEPFAVEYRAATPDGGLKWLRASGSLRRERELPARLVGATADVTADRSAREAQRLLAEAGDVLSSTLDLRETLRAVARLALGVLGNLAVIDLLEDGRLRRAEVVFADGRSELANVLMRFPPATPEGPQPSARAVSTGRTVLIQDLDDVQLRGQARGDEHLRVLREMGRGSVLSVPLTVRGQVLGAVTYGWLNSLRRHTEEDKGLAEEVARRMALAIDNARQHARLQEALAESRRFHALVEESTDFIAFADLEGRGLFINAAASRMVGLPQTEVTKSRIADYFPPEDHPRMHAVLEGALARGHAEAEIRLRNFQTGLLIPASWHVFLVRDPGGEPRYFATITRDLTRQKVAERERDTLIEQLQRGLRFSELFAGILGHDLRNPLTAIVNGAHALAIAAPDEKMRKQAGRILSSAQRMGRMIADLLDFTRIRLGSGISLRPGRVDLLPLCEEAVAELRAAHPGRKVVISSEGDCEGEWDGDRIAQVVSNLVGNALQHSPAESPVAVRLDGREDGRVLMSIHNEGDPLPEDRRAGLFEPFHTSSPGQGTAGLGLGLFIAHQLVSLHGGTIRAESAAGAGTTFVVELPRARVSAETVSS